MRCKGEGERGGVCIIVRSIAGVIINESETLFLFFFFFFFLGLEAAPPRLLISFLALGWLG